MLREDLMTWHCGKHALTLARPRIMGVLNVTPDSFSDGGAHDTTEAAIEWGLKLLDDGADIRCWWRVTRPGFRRVSPDEEARRVIPWCAPSSTPVPSFRSTRATPRLPALP